MKPATPFFAGLVALTAWACTARNDLVLSTPPAPVPADLGGPTTVRDRSRAAFSHPVANLGVEDRPAFEVGDSFFNQNWVVAPASTTARDGLGPLFNARSCSGCHSRDGRADPYPDGAPGDALLLRLSVPGGPSAGAPVPDPIYGGQFNHRAVPGFPAEGSVQVAWTEHPGTYADGTPYVLVRPTFTLADPAYGPPAADLLTSPRIAPQMIGLGLLESVPEADILTRTDPDDADGDGISGRPNWVDDLATGGKALGRFGWKANQPSIRQQVAGAFQGDLGITSPVMPDENHTPAQAATGLGDLPDGGKPELDERALQRVTFYSQHLAVPARREAEDPQVQRGSAVFHEIRCDACHVPTLRSGSQAVSPYLADLTFHPFTDLLLHDLGPDLADGRGDFAATGSEWRTPPLWGLGLIETVNGHLRLLHDGRARGFAEAILWHGGEAAASRDAFRALSAEDRDALVAFLGSL